MTAEEIRGEHGADSAFFTMTFEELWTKTKAELPVYIPKAAVEGLRATMMLTWNQALDSASEKLAPDFLDASLVLLTLKVPAPQTGN
jgi:hypothetical protein